VESNADTLSFVSTLFASHSIEKKMVQLSTCNIAGAVVSIVKLGRKIVHIGSLSMCGAAGDGFNTGYLFSDLLVCCQGLKGELVPRCIIDLKTAEIEPYQGWMRQYDDAPNAVLHAFGIHQIERKGKSSTRHEKRCIRTDVCAADDSSREVWITKLRECLSMQAKAGLRMPPLGIDLIYILSPQLCMYIYIYLCACMYMYMRMCIGKSTYICIYIYMYTPRIYIYIYVYIFICICMYMCVYVYIYMYT